MHENLARAEGRTRTPFPPARPADRRPAPGWRPSLSETPLVNLPLDDHALIRALAAGDQGAAGTLYDRHAPALLALATRLMGDRGEAEDLLHDVFVEVWAKAGAYDPARSTVRTWLIIRLRSRALDRLRSARCTRLAPLPPEDTLAARPVDLARATEQRRIRARLAGLPEEQRIALELAYFSGLSASEIAAQLAVPVGTVKSRLATGLKRLREASF